MACWTWLIILLLLPAGLAAEPMGAPDADEPSDTRAADALWPTPELIEFQLREAARMRAEQYALTEQQHARLESVLLERWPKFFRENEDDLRPLLTQLVEARTSPEPPDPERVARWADNALRMWGRIETEIAQSDEDISRLLNDQQRDQFRRDREEMRTRLHAVRQTLSNWKRGGFKPGDAWDRPPQPTAKANKRGPADRRPEPAGDPVENEVEAWTRYVQDFCSNYQLDRMQREAAYSILREMQQRALAHRDRYRNEIADMENKIATDGDADRDEIQARLARLYGPIDEMFQELDRRLAALPTSAQLRKARTANPATRPASQPAP